MLENGAAVFTKDRDNLSTLDVLCHLKSIDCWEEDKADKILDVLFEYGAEINSIPIAAAFGDLSNLTTLLEQGKDINDFIVPSCRTALHIAVLNGDYDMVNFLLEKGADINFTDDWDYSNPLDLCTNGKIEKLLKSYGAETLNEVEDAYHRAIRQQEGAYLDDRMFIAEIVQTKNRTSNQHNSVENSKEEIMWTVITRRNKRKYPPTRSDSFKTKEEAISYFKKILPETPMVSLNEKAQSPIKSYEEYKKWLITKGIKPPPY